MDTQTQAPRRRGRPPRQRAELICTRELLLRAGLEVLTEKGFAATGIEEILTRVDVPKGSFYHYFKSKEAFGIELIASYAEFFARKLDRHFLDDALAPLARIQAFIDDAKNGMLRYEFRRGCLIGNLGQEMAALPESFRSHLQATFEDWQRRLAACLGLAQKTGELGRDADIGQLAAFFWIGWEGAVLRARLERSNAPLDVFARSFFAGLPPQ